MQFSKGMPRAYANGKDDNETDEEEELTETEETDEETAEDEEELTEDEEVNDDDLEEEEGEEEETPDPAEPPASVSPDLLFPVLLRCAEARGDEDALVTYKEEYAVAKEEGLRKEALAVVRMIEEEARSGKLFGEKGLQIAEMSNGLMDKLASLFGSKNEAGLIQVEITKDGAEKTLTINSDGNVKLD